MLRNVLLTILGIILLGIVFKLIKYDQKSIAPINYTSPEIEYKEELAPVVPPYQENKEKPITQPVFTLYSPIRNVENLGVVLSDIESHMPAGHIYKSSDRITWSHETLHGIASNLRAKFNSPGVYVLQDRAVIIQEPKTTIQRVAATVPQELRGMSFNLYMVQQASSWGDTPSYIFDEWVAYTGGSEARLDLKITGRGETVQQMLEFSVYSIFLVKQIGLETDLQTTKFLKWNLKRSIDLYYKNKDLGGVDGATAYLRKMRQNPIVMEICQEMLPPEKGLRFRFKFPILKVREFFQ